MHRAMPSPRSTPVPPPGFGRLLPRVRVRPPGPASQRLARELARYESPGASAMCAGFVPIVWEQARGANILDADGNVYIDLTAGFGVAALGHTSSPVAQAIRRQSRALLHALGDVHPDRQRIELAQRLSRLAPGRRNQVIFCTSGSEAVELALKTAARATGKHGVLAFTGGFHGQTYGALAVTQWPQFRKAFEPQINPHVAAAPYPYCYRCPLKLAFPACDIACLKPVEETLDATPASVGPIGAVIIEPAQGRGGEIIPPPGYLKRLREICTKRGVLLIADELFTGFGRTGAWFAVRHEGVEPDLLCVGKALAGGMPLAACIGREEVMSAWRHRGPETPHSSTFMGHPLSCAAALAALDEMERLSLPVQASRLGAFALRRLREMQARRPAIGDVRGRGLMLGVELVASRRTKRPAVLLAGRVMQAALERGVILISGGTQGNVLSITPPLTITRRQLGHALDMLDAALVTSAPASTSPPDAP
jgi:4-aminobutyrate aminotransferase